MEVFWLSEDEWETSSKTLSIRRALEQVAYYVTKLWKKIFSYAGTDAKKPCTKHHITTRILNKSETFLNKYGMIFILFYKSQEYYFVSIETYHKFNLAAC